MEKVQKLPFADFRRKIRLTVGILDDRPRDAVYGQAGRKVTRPDRAAARTRRQAGCRKAELRRDGGEFD